MSRQGEHVAFFAAGAALGALLVALTGKTLQSSHALIVTRNSRKSSKDLSSIQNEEIPDSDIDTLLKINSLLDVIERDIVPLTCIAACDSEGGNKVKLPSR
jgi:uncharacterized protein involved in exopolysaccharide biosynthesis